MTASGEAMYDTKDVFSYQAPVVAVWLSTQHDPNSSFRPFVPTLSPGTRELARTKTSVASDVQTSFSFNLGISAPGPMSNLIGCRVRRCPVCTNHRAF